MGTGDASSRKDAEKLAALSACFQLVERGWLEGKRGKTHLGPGVGPVGGAAGGGSVDKGEKIKLSDGTEVGMERAREFMDYYCTVS